MKNIIFYSTSILTLLILLIITALLYDKGVGPLLIVFFAITNSKYIKQFCRHENEIDMSEKKKLYIIILTAYLSVIISTILYLSEIVRTLSIIFEFSLGLYFWAMFMYVSALLKAKKQ